MSWEIELPLGVAKFKITLDEFEKIIGWLSGGVQTKQAREILGQMIGEVSKSYETVVDIFTPFIALDDLNKFNDNFGNSHAAFFNQYIINKNFVRTQCHIVMHKLSELEASQSWQKNIPIIRRSFEKLQRFKLEWIGCDENLEQAMTKLLFDVETFLNDVEYQKFGDPETAFTEFRISLNRLKGDFLSVKDQLEQLTQVSKKL